jgi:hypothetical protein
MKYNHSFNHLELAMSLRLQNTSPSQPLWQNPVAQGAAAVLTIGAIAIGRGRLRYPAEIKRLANMMSNTDQIPRNHLANIPLEKLINQSIEKYGLNINGDVEKINQKIKQMNLNHEPLKPLKVAVSEPKKPDNIKEVVVVISGNDDMNTTGAASHEFISTFLLKRNEKELGLDFKNKTVLVALPNGHMPTADLTHKLLVDTPKRAIKQITSGEDPKANAVAASLQAVFNKYPNVKVKIVTHSAGAPVGNRIAEALKASGKEVSLTHLAPSGLPFTPVPKVPTTVIQHEYDLISTITNLFRPAQTANKTTIWMKPSDWDHSYDGKMDPERTAVGRPARKFVPMTFRNTLKVLFNPKSEQKLQLNHLLPELAYPLKGIVLKGLKQGLERPIEPTKK